MRHAYYEPSTSGWNVVNYRRREARRRNVRIALGGLTLLVAVAIAGVVFTSVPADAMQLMR